MPISTLDRMKAVLMSYKTPNRQARDTVRFVDAHLGAGLDPDAAMDAARVSLRESGMNYWDLAELRARYREWTDDELRTAVRRAKGPAALAWEAA